jgi:hypothetical protein
MKTNKKQPVSEGLLAFVLWLPRLLLRPLWTPEPDEKRFLIGLPITLFLILFLWKQGIPGPLGGYSIPAAFALWCAAYVLRFRQRLRNRGELKRAIIAPAVFIALHLGVSFY